jgi:hypothetical protein
VDDRVKALADSFNIRLKLTSAAFTSYRMKPPLPRPDSTIYDCSTETNTISLGLEHPNNKKRGGVIKGREQESEFSVGQSSIFPSSAETPMGWSQTDVCGAVCGRPPSLATCPHRGAIQ